MITKFLRRLFDAKFYECTDLCNGWVGHRRLSSNKLNLRKRVHRLNTSAARARSIIYTDNAPHLIEYCKLFQAEADQQQAMAKITELQAELKVSMIYHVPFRQCDGTTVCIHAALGLQEMKKLNTKAVNTADQKGKQYIPPIPYIHHS